MKINYEKIKEAIQKKLNLNKDKEKKFKKMKQNKERIEGTIQEEIKQNNRKIQELDHKISVLIENSFETKMLFVAMFSLIPWVLFTINIESFASFFSLQGISLTYAPTLLAGTIGLSVQTIFSKITKSKQKLEQFSISKSQVDRNEEQLRYEVEKEILKKRNETLKETLSQGENLFIIKVLVTLNLFDVIDTLDEKAREELKKLQTILKKNYLVPKKNTEINENVLQKGILKRNFKHIRNEEFGFLESIKFCLFGIGSTMVAFYFPIAGLFPMENLLTTIALGGILFGSYRYKKDKQDKIIFETMNKDLGSYALPEKENPLEEQKLKEEFESYMDKNYQNQLNIQADFIETEQEQDLFMNEDIFPQDKILIDNPKVMRINLKK